MNETFFFIYMTLIENSFQQGLLQYQIINPQIRWSQLFGTLEEHAERLGIVDYSVSQTSLEQVSIVKEISL